jgi:arylsulfatase A-like enzyme
MSEQAKKSKKPNILFIFEDHKAYYGHGRLGNAPEIHKPNFESVATEGVRFTNSYTACPLCGPARRTILTGVYPHTHGEIKNDSHEKYTHQIYFEKLAQAGYKNYYFGKWHAGKGNALDFGCEGFSMPRYGNPYITKEYEEYLEKNDLPFIEVEVQKDFRDAISESLGIKEGELYKPKFPVYSQYITGILTTPKETHEAFFLANLACDKLRELAKREDGEPFHMRIDFWGPHEPYFATQEYIDKYNPTDIPEHPNFRDDLKDKPEFYKYDTSHILTEDNKLVHPNPLPWSEWQKVLALNYAEQTLIDEAAGMILDTLRELGLAENTVVIWAADHGDAVGCHGGHFDKDAYMPQEIIRVPLAIRYPDMIPPGICDKFVNNTDYPATFLDIANTAFDNPIHGRSFLPLLTHEEDVEWRDDIFVETHGHFTTIVGRALITERYKYIWNENYMNELYNLHDDPWELTNLINNEEYADILHDMKQRLREWRNKTSDDVTFSMIRGRTLDRE